MAETKSKRRKLSAASVSASSPMRLLREAERSTVCREGFETLSRDKELWIIRVPREIDITSLSGEDIYLDGSRHTVSCGEKEYDVLASTSTAKVASSTVLIPSSKPGKLKSGPEIRGELSLLQTVCIPEVVVPPAQTSNDKVAVPVGLKQRWKPFGWKQPYTSQAKGHDVLSHKKFVKHKRAKKGKRLK